MIKLYTAPSCLSCRKVKKYFKDNNIEFVEKNIISTKLTKEDLYRMLLSSENGFDDIISRRSKIIKENNIDIDNMKLNELMDFIIENPTVLKRPIIVSDMELQVGYNVDDITLFLPPELRECQDCFTNEENCKYANSIKFEK